MLVKTGEQIINIPWKNCEKKKRHLHVHTENEVRRVSLYILEDNCPRGQLSQRANVQEGYCPGGGLLSGSCP